MSSDSFLLQTSVDQARTARVSGPPGPAGRRLRQALAAVALVAAAATLPARAEIVVGVFDPAFGPFIPNLGFRGTLAVDIPSACFGLPAGFVPNSNSCASGAMSIVSTTVDFYNTATGTTFSSIGPTFPVGSVAGIVTGFEAQTLQNELLGVDSGFGVAITLMLDNDGGTTDPADDVDFTGTMRLRFFAGPSANAAEIQACRNGDEQDQECALSNPAPTEFEWRGRSVPEPAPAVLVATALAVLALHRRGRGARSAA
jgi:hypothetical protein